MSRPLYQFRISFENVNCLGHQLATLLEHVKQFFNEGIWYACDIDTTCDNLKIEYLMNFYPQKIGSIDQLISLANSIDQFLSGVFLLMPNDYGNQLNIEYSTDDEQFRDIGNAILEIRAFDTTWFMLYSHDREIIDWLKNRFRGEVLVK